VITGLVTALVLVPLGQLLTTAYGIMVLVKAALVAAVAGAAIAGRAWLARGPDAGAGPATGSAPPGPPGRRSAPGPARAIRLECYGLAAVLAATAVLTVLTPPKAPIRAAPAASARAGHAAAGTLPRSAG